MIVGNIYFLDITSTTKDNSNHINLGINTAGGYANGSVNYYNVVDGSVAIPNIDLYFKTKKGDI